MVELRSLETEGAAQPRLAGSGFARDDYILVRLEPGTLGEGENGTAVEATPGGKVDIFDAGFREAQLRWDCQIFCAWADFQTLTKRSPKMMANCVLASVHSRGGRFQAWAA